MTKGVVVNKTDKLAWIVAVIIIWYIVPFLPAIPKFLYYGLMITSAVILYFRSGLSNLRVNIFMIFLYLVAILSLMFNDFPSFFNPWQRLASFIIMTLFLSSTINNAGLSEFRINLLSKIISLLRVVMVVSFVMMLISASSDEKGYRGILQHSMQLGPLAAITLIHSIYLVHFNHFFTKKKKFTNYFVVISSAICLLQSASRVAFTGCVIAITLCFFIIEDKNFFKFVLKYSKILTLLTILMPLWIGYTDKLEAKQNANLNQGGTLYSREDLWQRRIDEWYSSPIIGIGFSTIEMSSNAWEANTKTGSKETGSSWLAILSMTGILGLLAFSGTFIMAFVGIWKLSAYHKELAALLLSFQLFYSIHMMAEGYIFSGGEIISLNVWLLLGVMIGISKDDRLLEYSIDRFNKPAII